MVSRVGVEIVIGGLSVLTAWATGTALAVAPDGVWVTATSATLVAMVARTSLRAAEATVRPLLATIGCLSAGLVGLWILRLAHALAVVTNTANRLGYTEFFIVGIVAVAGVTMAVRARRQPPGQRLRFAAVGMARFTLPFGVVFRLFAAAPEFVNAIIAAGLYLVLREAAEKCPTATAVGGDR